MSFVSTPKIKLTHFRPVCPNLQPQTVFWNPNFHDSIADPDKSCVKKLLTLNDRHYYTSGSEKTPNKGSTVVYPNLGLGAVQSSMTKFGGVKNLVVEFKAYFNGSEDFRHARKSPFNKSSYSVAAVPIPALLESSDLTNGVKARISST